MEKKIVKLKKYWFELILLSIALVIAAISVFLYVSNSTTDEENQVEFTTNKLASDINQYIYIDLSGQVVKPDVYKVKLGTRLKQIIDLSGGLSKDADRDFFNRNFNLSRILSDQEKIYIPSVWEVNNSYFVENSNQPNYVSPGETNTTTTMLIDINDSTIEELDSLPGIGTVTASKIITNRPYQNIEELLNKKILKKNVYEQIKNLITVD